jgi:hypothetical protein
MKLKSLIKEMTIDKKKNILLEADKLTRKMELFCWRKYGIPILTEEEKSC